MTTKQLAEQIAKHFDISAEQDVRAIQGMIRKACVQAWARVRSNGSIVHRHGGSMTIYDQPVYSPYEATRPVLILSDEEHAESGAEVETPCAWCGEPEAHHGPYGERGPGKLCPVPGVSSQFYTPKPTGPEATGEVAASEGEKPEASDREGWIKTVTVETDGTRTVRLPARTDLVEWCGELIPVDVQFDDLVRQLSLQEHWRPAPAAPPEPELKPCPFCGGRSLRKCGEIGQFIQCETCMASAHERAWAQRVQTSGEASELERLLREALRLCTNQELAERFFGWPGWKREVEQLLADYAKGAKPC